jgi:capsule polysaccharide export protein KpsE/RkpR
MSSDPRHRGTSLPPATSERKVRDLDPSVEAELRLQLMQLRDHAIGTTAQVGELRARLREKDAELEKKNARIARLRKDFEQQETRMRATVTWRIGNFVMLPIRILRRLLRGS